MYQFVVKQTTMSTVENPKRRGRSRGRVASLVSLQPPQPGTARGNELRHPNRQGRGHGQGNNEKYQVDQPTSPGIKYNVLSSPFGQGRARGRGRARGKRMLSHQLDQSSQSRIHREFEQSHQTRACVKVQEERPSEAQPTSLSRSHGFGHQQHGKITPEITQLHCKCIAGVSNFFAYNPKV